MSHFARDGKVYNTRRSGEALASLLSSLKCVRKVSIKAAKRKFDISSHIEAGRWCQDGRLRHARAGHLVDISLTEN
jgi:hypothetical protein